MHGGHLGELGERASFPIITVFRVAVCQEFILDITPRGRNPSLYLAAGK